MKKIDDGGPAFPSEQWILQLEKDESRPGHFVKKTIPGMSLRDYFACMAMQTYMPGQETRDLNFMAREAYQYADALIAEKRRTEKEATNGKVEAENQSGT